MMKSRVKIAIIADVGLSMEEIFDFFRRFTPGCKGEWNNIVGTPVVEEADYYVILDKLPAEYSHLDPERRLLFQREPPYISNVFYEQDCEFKFGYDRVHHASTWYIRKSYDELLSMKYEPKPKKLSAVVSGKDWSMGHSLRLRFATAFAKKYPRLIDLYGRGLDVPEEWCKGEVDDKFDALKDYRYSLACQNGQEENYFTEILIDCFLAWTVPVYWGCPNIYDYFPEESLELIDIRDIDNIDRIPEIIDKPVSGIRIKALAEARERVLNRYNFWPTIYDVFERGFYAGVKRAS
jgi:hypothetical protein